MPALALLLLFLFIFGCTSEEAAPPKAESVAEPALETSKTVRRRKKRKNTRRASQKKSWKDRRRSTRKTKKTEDDPFMGLEMPDIVSMDELERDIEESDRKARIEAKVKRESLEAAERRAKGLPPDMRYMSPEEITAYLRK